MLLIDSHCHFDHPQFDGQREQILTHCQQLKVNKIIVPAVSAQHWQRLLTVCQSSAMLYPSLGLHPLFIEQHLPEHLIQLAELIEAVQPIAVGEIGLDFYLKNADKTAQIALLSAQLSLAQHAELPVLLHVRKAHDQVLALLKQQPVKGGIVHAFNGSLQQAQQYQALGFLFGVGGAITHPQATRLRKMVCQLPLSSLVLETDAPDMPVYQMQQARNTPENIPVILDALAALRNESKELIAKVTRENCQLLFAGLYP